MRSSYLQQNYLRGYRKRSGFSQGELAYFVQLKNKAGWCDLERFRRQPSLNTALACEEVFGVTVDQLFPGAKMSIARETRRRMRKAQHRLTTKTNTDTCLHRLQQKLHWLAERLNTISILPSP